MLRAAPILLLLLLPAAAAGPLVDGLDHLATQQRPDGTFPVPARYVVEAAAAAGEDPDRWPHPGRSAVAALEVPDDVDRLLRVVHALGVAGFDPASFDGTDLVARVRAASGPDGHGDPDRLNDDAWAVLALRAAGVAADDRAVAAAADRLRAGQNPDGGWSWNAGSDRSEADMTGMAVYALASAGRSDGVAQGAVAFLDGSRLDDGGWGLPGASASNCQSTVWALHGLVRLGQEPPPEAEALLESLRRDGGWAIQADRDSADAWCTAEAMVWLWQRDAVRSPWREHRDAGYPRGTGAGGTVTLSLPDAWGDVAWFLADGARRSGPEASADLGPGRHPVHVVVDDGVHRGHASGFVEVPEEERATPGFGPLSGLLALAAALTARAPRRGGSARGGSSAR